MVNCWCTLSNLRNKMWSSYVLIRWRFGQRLSRTRLLTQLVVCTMITWSLWKILPGRCYHRDPCPCSRLVNVIGGSDQLADSDITQVTQLRSVLSLLTLLKCRSVKVLGVQLLITFMLITRATSRQVSKYNSKHNSNSLVTPLINFLQLKKNNN